MNKENLKNFIEDSPKKKKAEINETTVREILDMEFDALEEWVETELDKIKNQCIDDFNNFHISIPSNKQIQKESINIDEDDI
jgi:hypothetical protein